MEVRKKLVKGMSTALYTRTGQFCGRNVCRMSTSASRSRAGSCTGLPLRANSSPCSSTENSDSAQNAVSNAMTTRHRMMAGETKMSEALLLFR